MDGIEQATAEVHAAERAYADAAGNPDVGAYALDELGHKAATAYARLVTVADHAAPGWGQTIADLYLDGDGQAADAITAAGARA